MKLATAVVLTTATMAATTTAEDNFVTSARPDKVPGVTLAISEPGSSHTDLKPLVIELMRPDATRIADALNTVLVESKRPEPESDPRNHDLPHFPGLDVSIMEICRLVPKRCPYWVPRPTPEDLRPHPTASVSMDEILGTMRTDFKGPVAPIKTASAAKAFVECNTEDRSCKPFRPVPDTPSSSLPTSLPTTWRRPICHHCRPLPTNSVLPTPTSSHTDRKPPKPERDLRPDPSVLSMHHVPTEPPTPGLNLSTPSLGEILRIRFQCRYRPEFCAIIAMWKLPKELLFPRPTDESKEDSN